MNLQEHVALAPLTTLNVGGEARFFVVARSIEEVTEALDFSRAHKLPLFVLGGGSNILIADDGFDGLVLALKIPGITFENRGDSVRITAGAGVAWDDLVVYSVEHGFAGFECLSGIPGTVGGAVAVNLGAYGEQCSDTFISADVLDRTDEKNAIHVFNKEACDFSYHDSMFSRALGRYIVLRATFQLATTGTPRLAYRDNRFNLEDFASKNGREPTLAEIRTAVLKVREEKGALGSSYKSAGSFFHMPYVSPEKHAQIAGRAHSLDAKKEEQLRPWAWEQPDGSYRIAPGFLLEYTEFQKGYARDSVGISPKHTLSIINIANAHARDVAQLARDMQDAVKKIFSVDLEREVEYVGAVERME
jgi:UDP-N-acetylmuramate dehydrogenase